MVLRTRNNNNNYNNNNNITKTSNSDDNDDDGLHNCHATIETLLMSTSLSWRVLLLRRMLGRHRQMRQDTPLLFAERCPAIPARPSVRPFVRRSVPAVLAQQQSLRVMVLGVPLQVAEGGRQRRIALLILLRPVSRPSCVLPCRKRTNNAHHARTHDGKPHVGIAAKTTHVVDRREVHAANRRGHALGWAVRPSPASQMGRPYEEKNKKNTKTYDDDGRMALMPLRLLLPLLLPLR